MNDMFQNTDSSDDEIYGIDGKTHVNGKRNIHLDYKSL